MFGIYFVNIIPMSKDQTVTKGSHIFSLNNIKNDCYYSSVTADFTPPLSLNKASNSIVPAYLVDHNFFTPAFIISRDKEYYATTSQFQRKKFQVRILKANRLCEDDQYKEQNIGEISQPMPTTNYCQICKNNYTSYQDHLRDTSHQRQARFSKANTYISQLCKKYSKNKPKIETKGKCKGINKKMSLKHGRKQERTKQRGSKVAAENPLGAKYNNHSTNVPSVVPSCY